MSLVPAVAQQPLGIIADRGYLLDLPNREDRGYHQKIGFNGSKYFMLLQFSGMLAGEEGHGCTQLADQIVVWTADRLTGPWSPRGGSIENARITPCDVSWPSGVEKTTWGVGSLFQYSGTWYLTVDAGHGGDEHKDYVYLITSPDGIDWEDVDPSDLIIDGSSLDQKFLYTTVIETGLPKMGFFFWTGIGTQATPMGLGYGQIDLGAQSSPRVHLLRDDGQYEELPATGAVNFTVLDLVGPENPRPSGARLTGGLDGMLLGHNVRTVPGGVSTGGCPPDGSNKVNELITWPFTLTGLDDPRVVLCGNRLCDPTLDPVDGALHNPRNGNPSLIQPDWFTDSDGRSYLIPSAGGDCRPGWLQLTPQRFETAGAEASSPRLTSVKTSSPSWDLSGSSRHRITVMASDADGLGDLRTYINLQGSNAANRRGELSWKHDTYLWPWAAEKMPCSGGGFAAKSPASSSGGQHLTLLDCTTSLVGTQRIVAFTVRPQLTFGTFGAIHDISGYARDLEGNVTSYTNFDTNFSSASGDTIPPDLVSVDSGGHHWNIADSSSYSVTVRASDDRGLDEVRAYINLQGSNAANRRGELSWKQDAYLWPWADEKMPCSGGGFAAKSTNLSSGAQHITLVDCTTRVVGHQRVVTFTVRPRPTFGVFGPINDISASAKDLSGNARTYMSFSTDFKTSMGSPP